MKKLSPKLKKSLAYGSLFLFLAAGLPLLDYARFQDRQQPHVFSDPSRQFEMVTSYVQLRAQVTTGSITTISPVEESYTNESTVPQTFSHIFAPPAQPKTYSQHLAFQLSSFCPKLFPPKTVASQDDNNLQITVPPHRSAEIQKYSVVLIGTEDTKESADLPIPHKRIRFETAPFVYYGFKLVDTQHFDFNPQVVVRNIKPKTDLFPRKHLVKLTHNDEL